jgi:small subunit ribosomal protein S1
MRGCTVTDPSEDFASLFEASTKAKRIEKGQTVEGTVVAIGPDVAFIDVGGKGEATVDLAELKDDDGRLEVKVGDRIQAVAVSTTGGLTLSRRLARSAATARQVEDAFHTGLPVEGRVERVVKGGYEVRIGRQRAFCPFSQMEIGRTEPSTHEGGVYEFRITEYRDGGRNIVVSRRALLEEAQRAAAAVARASIVPGAVLTGRVTSVRDFGAFVDLGAGVQGLVPASEMTWSRDAHPSSVVETGQQITVVVLRADHETDKITLGLKQLQADPWLRASETYQVGATRTGRVTRLAPFGAFIELEPGIEALAHASTFTTGSPDSWSSGIKRGTMMTVEILSVDTATRRIAVAPAAGVRPEAADDLRAYAERQKTEGAPFGSLADKLRSALGTEDKE